MILLRLLGLRMWRPPGTPLTLGERARDEAAASNVTVATYVHRMTLGGSYQQSQLKRVAGLLDSLDGLKSQALEKAESDPERSVQLWRQYDVLAAELRQLLGHLQEHD